MKLNAYSIYDTASGAYTRPFFLQSDAQALRTFKDVCNDSEHEIGKHPEDYTLFRIGIFDDNRAELIKETPEALATALEMVAKARNPQNEIGT